MAYGRPVVATRVGGLADLGDGAVYVPVNDVPALRSAVAGLLGDSRHVARSGTQRERAPIPSTRPEDYSSRLCPVFVVRAGRSADGHDSRVIVEALRLPGPFIPGWFPLVVEHSIRLVGPSAGERSARVLGSQMCLDTRESMQRRYFYHCYEAPEAAFLRRWLRPGDRAADVGAHVGIFTLLAAKLRRCRPGASMRSSLFPDNFRSLNRNIALNGYSCVTAEMAAVSDTPGAVTLGLHEERSVGSSTADFSIGGTLSTVQALGGCAR